MMLSDTNETLAVNAYYGAKIGTTLVLVNNRASTNTDCTWTFRKGLWLSDTNPSLQVFASGGIVNGSTLQLTNNNWTSQ